MGPDPLKIHIPGWKDLALRHLVLDLNGTLAGDGRLMPGVTEALIEMRDIIDCRVVTADTRGLAAKLIGDLAALEIISPGNEGPQKNNIVKRLGPEKTACMGNGANDAQMLKQAALGVAVNGPEGLNKDALLAADLVVGGPVEGFELLLHPTRLIATMRR